MESCLPVAPGFKPNFSASHSIILERPLDEVFAIIGTSEGHERVTRLSELCSDVRLLHLDAVAIPSSSSLSDISVRHLSSCHASDGQKTLPRQWFELTETVPVLFGLVSHAVHIVGCLTWDEDNHLALYESQAGMGITVWKLRTFERLSEDRTKVTEKIQGRCPALLKGMVQNSTTSAHGAHVASYYSLFS